MRIGSKKIFHLEAWAVKVMSLYKVSSYFTFLFPAGHVTSRIILY